MGRRPRHAQSHRPRMTEPTGKPHRIATALAHVGRRPEWTGTADQPGAVVNPAVWRASTHLYPNIAALREGAKTNADGRFYYGRRGGPTQWALAEALTAIEPGAAGTVLYSAGEAAIAGVMLAVLRPGDVVLMTDNAYEPTRVMVSGVLKDWGVEPRWFAPTDPDALAAAICPHTRMLVLESPGSLTLEVQDVPAMAASARARGVVTVLDNTWASPLGFAALAHVDISVMSLTKHVGGHSDLMLGSASAGPEWYGRLRRTAQSLGLHAAPDECALALRGLRTMGVRLKQESASALQIAQWLAGREEIARVLCPMLPGAPGHDLWRRDFTGGCGLFSFVLRGGTSEARDALIDALGLFGIGYSWGGFESLAVPVDPARSRTATAWPPAYMAPEDRFGVRLSIGLEDPEDLIADLTRGLAVWAKAR